MKSIPREGDTKLEVLLAIRDYRTHSRYGPTVAELRDEVGLSSRSTVQFHINHLVDDGYLSQVSGKRRTLRVTDKGHLLIQILGVDDEGEG